MVVGERVVMRRLRGRRRGLLLVRMVWLRRVRMVAEGMARVKMAKAMAMVKMARVQRRKICRY